MRLSDPHMAEDRTPWLEHGMEQCEECGEVGRQEDMVRVNDDYYCRFCAPEEYLQ